MNYLLDTCVISETVRKEPSGSVMAWLGSVDEERFFLSVLTFGELQKGVAKLPDSAKRRRLQSWLDSDLRSRFHSRVLEVNLEVAQRWGELLAQAEQTGKPLPAVDALIAATALTHNLTIVTRNVGHLANSTAQIFDPWNVH